MLLVLNVGSSSIKFAVFDKQQCLYRAKVERVGEVLTYAQAMGVIIRNLKKQGILISSITHIAHRVVHGGPLRKPTVLTQGVVKMLERYVELAPLHEAPELAIVKWCLANATADNIGVFDTAFHATIPVEQFTYALPASLRKKYSIRRYGFHGLSHKSMLERATQALKKMPRRLITCHLGAGSSITAIYDGHSIDTSMGMTPLEGVVMGSRCGSIDPSLPLLIMEHEHLSPRQMLHLLNEESGFKGLVGKEDIRDVAAMRSKDSQCAIRILINQVVKYVGAYAALMGGIDAIAFSGGIGENHAEMREAILAKLAWLGVIIDKEANKKHRERIMTKDSDVAVLVVPANEEWQIAQEAMLFMRGGASVHSISQHRSNASKTIEAFAAIVFEGDDAQ
ncbi:acetate/propionate family kinase [Candidatus Woesearchaeota archaeon]|nr:acetate/propionate family kinase [Candidatus Woesearchaeota archaeon]